MTKETMIKNYRKFAAHDAYIIGFVINGKQYITFIDELMPRWIYLTHESSSHGGGQKSNYTFQPKTAIDFLLRIAFVLVILKT